MPKMWTTIQGMTQALSAILGIARRSRGSELVDVLRPVGTLVKGDQKQRAPERTGFLKDHIDEETKATGLYTAETEIGPRGVDYAAFPEFGTSRQPAQPYIRPSLDENESEIRSVIRRKLGTKFGR